MYFETWIDTDLQKPVTPTQLYGVFFQGDAAANLLGVNVYSGGEPFALDGSCKAYIYRAMEKAMILGDTPANHELFEADERTAFVPLGDAKALAEKIKTFSVAQ